MRGASRFIIKGTVQGVFFRQFIKENADNYKLKGFVRNLESSEVEVVVEGEKEDIEKFFKKIKVGNDHSQIRDIKIEEKKWSGDFKEFKVLRF